MAEICEHFGFQSTGTHFLDLVNISHEHDKRPEDLFQRLTAFFEHNLLTVGCGVTHHGVATAIDEEVSPSLKNTIVYLWLQLIYPGLPLLVKHRYGAELRNRSMASLKSEVSQALASLQDELCNIEDTRAMRIGDGFKYNRKVVASSRRRSVPHKSCVLCKAAGRMFNRHDLIDCRYSPQSDLGWSRLVTNDVCEKTRMTYTTATHLRTSLAVPRYVSSMH